MITSILRGHFSLRERVLIMTKAELFIELAEPDKDGISRWVFTSEFVGKYSELELLNGLSWGRKSSALAKKYNIATTNYQRFKADKTKNRNHKASSTEEYLHMLEK